MLCPQSFQSLSSLAGAGASGEQIMCTATLKLPASSLLVTASLVVKTRNSLEKTHTRMELKTIASKKLKFSGTTNCNKYHS